MRAAIEFVKARQHERSRLFGLEVGAHLFFELYGGDEAYVRRLDPTKPDSPADISRATGIPYSTLYLYLVAAMVKDRLEKAGVPHRLDMKHLYALDELDESIEAMGALARWASGRGVGYRELERIADRWRQHLDEGGTVEDLLADPAGPGPSRRRGRRRDRSPAHVLLASRRMLVVLSGWWKRSRISPANKERLRGRLLAIRGLLAQGQG